MPIELPLKSDVKKILSLAAPYTVANLLQAISEEINNIILSRASNSILAASGLSALAAPVSLIFNASLIGLQPIISESDGKGDKIVVTQIVQQGWIFGTLFCIPQIVIFSSSMPLLEALHQQPHLIEIAKPFFDISIFGLPAVAYLATNTAYMYGRGKTRPVLFQYAFNLASGAALNAALVLGTPFTPSLGFKGYAIAMVTQAWLNCFYSMAYLKYFGKKEGYHFFKINFTNFKTLAKRFLRLGSSLTAKLLAVSGATIYKQSMIGSYGENAILAVGVAAGYSGIILYINDSISQSVCTIIGQAIGRKDKTAIKNYAKAALCCSLTNTLLFSLPAFVDPQAIGKFFIKDTSTQDMSLIADIMRISLLQSVFDSISQVFTGAFLGRENSNAPAITSSVVFLLVTLPVTLSLHFEEGLEARGISIGYLAGSIVQSIVMGCLWSRELSKICEEEERENGQLSADDFEGYLSTHEDSTTNLLGTNSIDDSSSVGMDTLDRQENFRHVLRDGAETIFSRGETEETKKAPVLEAGLLPHMNFLTSEYVSPAGKDILQTEALQK